MILLLYSYIVVCHDIYENECAKGIGEYFYYLCYQIRWNMHHKSSAQEIVETLHGHIELQIPTLFAHFAVYFVKITYKYLVAPKTQVFIEWNCYVSPPSAYSDMMAISTLHYVVKPPFSLCKILPHIACYSNSYACSILLLYAVCILLCIQCNPCVELIRLSVGHSDCCTCDVDKSDTACVVPVEML